jgi:hypothetical protein
VAITCLEACVLVSEWRRNFGLADGVDGGASSWEHDSESCPAS